eukprot:762138-Hanusia_phi.AAC.4
MHHRMQGHLPFIPRAAWSQTAWRVRSLLDQGKEGNQLLGSEDYQSMTVAEPLNKEAFDFFFGESPSISPVSSSSNLMLDFNIQEKASEWVDEFETIDFKKMAMADKELARLIKDCM